MTRVNFLERRLLPLLIIVLLILVPAVACGGSSDKTLPTAPIEYITPESSAVAGVNAPSPAASAQANPSASGQGSAAADTTVNITVKDTKFSTDTITVPAGKTITIHMTNDDNIIHNIAFYQQKDAPEALYTGELFKGPNVTKTETFQAPDKPGTYYFQCDVHPDQMNGKLVVK